MDFLIGAIGAITVIALLLIGFSGGYVFARHFARCHVNTEIPTTDKSRLRQKERDEAFDQLTAYSMEEAYGITRNPSRGGK